MAQWPCSNPSCNSFGHPHPNCKCPPPHAEGGEVENYCAKDRPHLEGCEYFQEGGEVGPDWNSLSTTPPKPSPIPGEDNAPDWDSLQTADQRFGSTGQQIKAGLEGLAQGIAGPLATLAETKILGVKPEDIKAREEVNPFIHTASEAAGVVGGLFTGVGEAALISKAVGKAAEAAQLASKVGTIGSSMIKGAIDSGLLQGGDEISNYLLGKGDPQSSVASRLAYSGASGLLAGGLFGGTSKALSAVGDAKLGAKMKSFLYGAGLKQAPVDVASSLPEIPFEGFSKSAADAGFKFTDGMIGKVGETLTGKAAEAVGATVGHSVGGLPGTYVGYESAKKIKPFLERVIGKPLSSAAQRTAIPVVLKALSTGETSGLFQTLNEANNLKKGAQKINDAVGMLFKSGGNFALESLRGNERDRDRLKSYIDNNEMNQQLQDELNQPITPQFAHGGDVKPPAEINPFDKQYPEQSMYMSMAKGRINNYLQSVKPQKDMAKLPFDHVIQNKDKERHYNKILDLANEPLSILNDVKRGTLTPQTLGHFQQLYPELHDHLAKKITEHITHIQADESKKPPYHVRQALGLFMGTPLDSSMSPATIQLNQQIFAQDKANRAQAPQSMGKPKKGTSVIEKAAKPYQTASQALETRQQRDH